MHRRAFLAALSTAAAGCSALSSPGTPTLTPVDHAGDETPTESPTPTPGDPDEPLQLGAASVVRLESGPRTLALSPPSYRGPDGGRVRVQFVDTATATSPARLRAELTNGNDWTNVFRLRDFPPFGRVHHARIRDPARDLDHRSTVSLVPPQNHGLYDGEPTYERGPEGFWRLTGGQPEPDPTVRLGPGESVAGEYFLLGNEERVGFPTGEYSFEWRDHGFTIAAWDADAPGPEEPSRFEGADPPSLPNSEAMAWYHDADRGTETYLRPSTERVDDAGRVDFTLVNHSTEPMGGNPYDWGLYKLVDGAWHLIEPWAIPLPAGAVPPGETYEYVLRAFHGDAVPCDDGHDVGHLGGGTYAFEAGFSRKDAHGTHAALFGFEAPDLTVTPPDGPSVSRDGRTVTVTTGAWGDGEHPPDATLTVEPVGGGDGGDDATPIIPEQLYRRPYRALRHVLPRFGPAVDRVVLRADKHVVQDAVAYDSNVTRFRYGEQVYDAEKWVAPRDEDGGDDEKRTEQA